MNEDHDRGASEIFADALALAHEERAAFLDRTCGGDTDLREEVQSLLSSHSAAQGLFRSLDLAHYLADALDGGTDDLIGRTIGSYRITRAIATGGMGAVYLAERTDDAFHKEVAIKLLHPGWTGADALARFRTERQVLADLEHPGIARLFDGGSTEEGIPYLVMEYVDGTPIDRHCIENRLSLHDRLALVLSVCEAVAYAHKNLVIHRDLKPSNILVDRSGQTRLLDFGIAKVLEPTGPGDRSESTTVFRALTPRYASPEQVRGERMTTSTDIYSLGVVSYELLTGIMPYDLSGRSPADVERIVCEEPVTRPSRAALQRKAPRDEKPRAGLASRGETAPGSRFPGAAKSRHRLSGDIDTILLKALSKEPERRYASVDDFAADLRRHLAGLPVHARPDTAAYRISKFVQRHTTLVVGVLAVILVLAGALGVVLRQYREATVRAREAQSTAYVNSLGAAESSILLNRAAEAAAYLYAAPDDLRGWEWRHLQSRVDRSLRSWQGHTGGVTSVLYSVDGSRFLTSSVDSTVKLWDAETAECVRTWGPFESEVEGAAFDPEGRFIAAGLNDGDVLLLPMEAGEPRVLHRGGAWARVAVRPDGERLVAGFFDGTVTVWDSRSGSSLQTWRAHNALALPLYTPRGTFLITGGDDGRVKVWDPDTHALLRECQAHERRIYSMAVSLDENRVVTGSMDRIANVWNVVSLEQISTFNDHTATISSLAFHSKEARVASGGADAQLSIWDATSGQRVVTLHGHQADPSALASNERGLISGDWSGNLRFWDWDTEDVRVLALPRIRAMVVQARDVAVDPSGTRVACAANMETLPVWEVATHEAPATLGVRWARRVRFSADGNRLVAASDSGLVVVMDSRNGTGNRSLQAHGGPVLALAVDPQDRWIATSSTDSLVKIWAFDDFDLVRVLSDPGATILDLEYSPAGDQIASAGSDGAIHVWEAGELTHVFRGHTAAVLDICWSPDGRRLASVSQDGSLRIRDLVAGSERVFPMARSSWVAVAYSADGSRLAVGGLDQAVTLLDPETGRELVSLHGHVAGIVSLVFSPRDEFLVSASNDGTVRIWDSTHASTGAPGSSPLRVGE